MENIKCWVLKGVYQDENAAQLKKCKKCMYYITMNHDTGILSEANASVAVVSCEGSLNAERTKALEKVWENIKQHNRFKIILNLTNVNNIYSCGIGAIIKMHKETAAANGLLVVVAADNYVTELFSVTKVSRILKVVPTLRDANEFFEILREKEDAQKVAAKPDETLKPPKPVKPKERPACYVYFNNHNPKNATNCDECFKKISPPGQPCWIVEGMIEGISFQYVSEDCEGCPYFAEFGPSEE